MSWSDAIHRANVWPSGNGLATILQAQKNSYVGLQYQTRTDYDSDTNPGTFIHIDLYDTGTRVPGTE
jgi:hypothetical protein